MSSTFSGLSTALSALFAQRRGLDLTGQNVANANTEGYSRQRVNLEAIGAPAQPALFATYEGSGGGVNVADVQRLRDAFLETRAHTEHGRMSFLAERRAALAQVEDLLAEPGDAGLQNALSEFWNAWGDLSNKPDEDAPRAQLLERAKTLVDSLDAAQGALSGQWTASRTRLQTVVDEVNTIARDVAELNVAIQRGVQAGASANELADQRDLLVLKLADLTGVTTRAGADGMIDVYLGGRTLVRGASSAEIAVAGAASFPQATADPPTRVAVTWAADGYPAVVEGGTSAGLLDTLNGTLPAYGNGLRDFAGRLAEAVNAEHRKGYGQDDTAPSSRDFFAVTTQGAGIRVAIGDDELRDIAASGYPNAADGGVAAAIGQLVTRPDGPDAAYRKLVVDLGVAGQTARQRVTIQTTITTQVDASREAEAGVDIDEEMVNMLSFQRAYEGAARMLTAVDEAIDILINRTGLVGR